MLSCEGGHMSVRKPWRLRSRGAIATVQVHARRTTY